jgi:hypothetical protein
MKLERIGMYSNGIFHNQGKELNVKILGLGIINDINNPIGGNNIPKEANAYVIGDRESPASSKFPIIYLKIIY